MTEEDKIREEMRKERDAKLELVASLLKECVALEDSGDFNRTAFLIQNEDGDTLVQDDWSDLGWLPSRTCY